MKTGVQNVQTIIETKSIKKIQKAIDVDPESPYDSGNVEKELQNIKMYD